MLTDSQLKLIAETLSNVGLVFFASLVVPIFFSPEVNFGIAAVGFSLALAFWFSGLLIIKDTEI